MIVDIMQYYNCNLILLYLYKHITFPLSYKAVNIVINPTVRSRQKTSKIDNDLRSLYVVDGLTL